jgi:cytochrome c oxidase assembly protein subunit 11
MTAGGNNRRLALLLSGLVVGMVGLSFAAVPLYRLFCQVTGFAGTPNIVAAGSATTLERRVTVRFNADTDRNLPWYFRPAQASVQLQLGEQGLAHYEARNLSDRTIVGTATFNVTPLKAGQYFSKIECFCFTEQRLEPGQTVDMPVAFYVDPRLNDDPSMADVTTITLSYTFYRVAADDRSPPARAASLSNPSSSHN